ncbi:hypothetical protein E2C01_064282 [Portunus trituberculatus]|uniref:Uncharacterized protein n=1 Tax=Portunus trituberculatus TaxID=210409 RepID=A0A5B7HJB7_PORTR|nr:hypothetical protein [Portunus trituberculatus]
MLRPCTTAPQYETPRPGTAQHCSVTPRWQSAAATHKTKVTGVDGLLAGTGRHGTGGAGTPSHISPGVKTCCPLLAPSLPFPPTPNTSLTPPNYTKRTVK